MVSARIAIGQSGTSFGDADGAANVRSVAAGSCPAAIDREKYATGFAKHRRRKSAVGLGRAAGLKLHSLIPNCCSWHRGMNGVSPDNRPGKFVSHERQMPDRPDRSENEARD